jgi:hypothetical protein
MEVRIISKLVMLCIVDQRIINKYYIVRARLLVGAVAVVKEACGACDV